MRLGLAFAILAALAGPAFGALTLDPAALAATAVGPAVVAQRETLRDNARAIRLTLYWENDGNFAKPFDEHDRHYTAGLGASLAFRAAAIDALLEKVPSIHEEFAHADYALGLIGALTIFSPEDFTNPDPIPSDRPFAGYTYGGIFAQRARRTPGPAHGLPAASSLLNPASYSAFESLELDLGILGPSSLAQNAQELIHHTLDYPYPQGWNNQIHDEPQFSIKYQRRWRSLAIRPFDSVPLDVQVIPEVGLTAGTLIDDLRAGATVRLGYRLPDDFGPGELANPGDFTFQAPCACPGGSNQLFQSAYIFVRPYGRLVAHNALLQGDNFRDDDPVTQTPAPAVGAIQLGCAVQFLKHFELSWSTTFQTREFQGQRGCGDSWASLSLSYFLAW